MADLSSTRVFGKLTVLHEAILKANAEITGAVTASSFAGDGSLLTNLNASNLSSGTVPETRLPASALVGDTTYSAGTGISLSGTTFSLTNESYTSAEKTKLAGIEAGAEVNVGTNLGTSGTSTTRTVTSSTGSNVSLPSATTSTAGVMSASDKTKLNGIEAGAEVNVATNLGQSRNTTSYTVTSSTGTNTTLAAATTSSAGVLTASDKAKLDGIEAGAEVNDPTNLGQSRNATSYTITSSTGTNTTLAAATTAAAGVMSAADKAKLNGIQAGAGANWYLDGLTFNTADGVLTASVNGTTNQTVDLDGRYATGDNFNSSGTYANLRARATTKADVGLSGIPNTNGSTVSYLRGDGSWVRPKVQQESQTVSVTTGQTTINLTTLTVSSASLPTITVDGYYGVELIRDFTVTNSTTITLGSPIQANGQLTVTNYVAS